MAVPSVGAGASATEQGGKVAELLDHEAAASFYTEQTSARAGDTEVTTQDLANAASLVSSC